MFIWLNLLVVDKNLPLCHKPLIKVYDIWTPKLTFILVYLFMDTHMSCLCMCVWILFVKMCIFLEVEMLTDFCIPMDGRPSRNLLVGCVTMLKNWSLSVLLIMKHRQEYTTFHSPNYEHFIFKVHSECNNELLSTKTTVRNQYYAVQPSCITE